MTTDPPKPNSDAARQALVRQFSEQAGAYAVSRAHAEGATRLMLVEHLQPVTDETLLDLGSGPGHTGLAFAPYVRRVVALDLALPMLRAARLAARRLEGAAESGTPLAALDPVCADAHRLPFRERALDLVTMRSAAHHVADLDTALSEIRRVLRRGGRLGVVDDVVPDDDAAAAAFIDALERRRDPTTVRLRPATQWRAALEQAGMRVDMVEPKAFDLAEPRSLTAWVALAGGASEVLAEMKRMLLTAPRAIREQLRVRTNGDDLTFDLPKLVMTATRID